MPIYDYQCKCGHYKEQMVKTSDQLVECPKCGEKMVKQLSSPCFILKGVGVTSNGSFKKAKAGPKLDEELLRLSDADLDRELGYSLD